MPSTGAAEAPARSGHARSRHLRPLATAKLVHGTISNVPSVIHVRLSADARERTWTAVLKRDPGYDYLWGGNAIHTRGFSATNVSPLAVYAAAMI